MKHKLDSGNSWNAHRYMPAVDGLRAVAVLLVILGHSYVAMFPGGGVGVDIFFAISGFLITGLLIVEYKKYNKINLLKFYGRRALRLFPALYLMLGVTFLFLQPQGLHVFSIVFYFSNWVRAGGDHMSFYGHTWSLSVEEQFYIFWPLIIILCGWIAHKRASDLAKIVLIFALAGSVVSVFLQNLGWSEDRIYNGTDTRMIGLLLGAAGSVVVYKIYGTVLASLVNLLAIPIILILIWYFLKGQIFSPQIDQIILPISCALLVLSAAMSPVRMLKLLLENKVSLYIGKISYGLYL